jgi:tetratricopeptide (TPR) repeat protein
VFHYLTCIYLMKQFLLGILFMATTALTARAQEYHTLIRKADSLYSAGDYKQSLRMFEQGFKLEQNKYLDLYSAARSAALAGEKKKAFTFLELAIQKGLKNVNHVKSNPALQPLHDDPQWQALMNKWQNQSGTAPQIDVASLQTELWQILETDQEHRMKMEDVQKAHGRNSTQMQDLIQTMRKQDSLNLTKVKAILDKHGWLGPDMIGKQANLALFLVIQHSDQRTQEKYLPMLQDAVRKGNAQAQDLALLQDRVALGQGKKQLYGSQIGTDASGKMYVLPLEDPDNVDTRRQSVGLPPMAAYVQHFGFTWDVEAYKKQQAKK